MASKSSHSQQEEECQTKLQTLNSSIQKYQSAIKKEEQVLLQIQQEFLMHYQQERELTSALKTQQNRRKQFETPEESLNEYVSGVQGKAQDARSLCHTE
jgi:chromosome segregation ATPase